MGFVLRRGDQFPGVTTASENPLDEEEGAAGKRPHSFGTIPALHIGTVDADCQQPSIGVGQDMALAPAGALSGTVSFAPPLISRPDHLTVDDGGGWRGFVAAPLPALHNPRVMDTGPHAFARPSARGVIDRLPGS